MPTAFTTTTLPILDKPVHRLGLAPNYGIDGAGFERAVERGVNYIFWTHLMTKKVRPAMRAALKRDRARFVVVSGPSLGYFGGSVRRGVERMLKELETDYLDVCHLGWLGKGAAWTDSVLDAYARLKDEGKVRTLGISIHDRPRAGKLAEDPRLGVLMMRYNAAHPGAERDIFPHFEKRRPACVAYTATSHTFLLRKKRRWSGRPMTAGECYRFCLSSPHVDVVLTGPASGKEMDENLDALEQGPLAPDEEKWMREFGRVVHG